MNQIVIGAAASFCVAAVIYLCRRCRAGMALLVGAPLFMALGSLWAVVPDLPRLWGDHQLYSRLSHDPRMNIFLFHYAIDQTESDSSWWFVLFVAMVGALIFVAWRELALRESRELR